MMYRFLQKIKANYSHETSKKAKINMIYMDLQTLVMYQNIRVQRWKIYLNSSHEESDVMQFL